MPRRWRGGWASNPEFGDAADPPCSPDVVTPFPFPARLPFPARAAQPTALPVGKLGENTGGRGAHAHSAPSGAGGSGGPGASALRVRRRETNARGSRRGFGGAFSGVAREGQPWPEAVSVSRNRGSGAGRPGRRQPRRRGRGGAARLGERDWGGVGLRTRIPVAMQQGASLPGNGRHAFPGNRGFRGC